ncbi:MAG TPA: transcriptional regulator [Acidobacteria bacterium]|nr:transcriptional regulator [Acidobacteriota bacterium]
MPEICRFYGIIIKMYFDDHNPPHFHAEYGSEEALMDINSLALIAGQLSPRALGLVAEWASLHQAELKACWEKARSLESLGKIEPLR